MNARRLSSSILQDKACNAGLVGSTVPRCAVLQQRVREGEAAHGCLARVPMFNLYRIYLHTLSICPFRTNCL